MVTGSQEPEPFVTPTLESVEDEIEINGISTRSEEPESRQHWNRSKMKCREMGLETEKAPFGKELNRPSAVCEYLIRRLSRNTGHGTKLIE